MRSCFLFLFLFTSLFTSTSYAQDAMADRRPDFGNVLAGGGLTLGTDAWSTLSGTLQAGAVYYVPISERNLLSLGGAYRLVSRGYRAYPLTSGIGFSEVEYASDDITMISIPLALHNHLGDLSDWTIYAGPSVDLTLAYNGGDYTFNYSFLNLSLEGGVAYLGKVFVMDAGLSFPLTNGFRSTQDDARSTPVALRVLVGWRLFTL